MRAIIALGLKDIRLLFRSKGRLFFTLVWPLLVAVMFGLIFGGTGPRPMRLSIAVTDEDGTSSSKEFAARLAKRAVIDAVFVSRAEGLDHVRRGRRVAAVILPRGFGEAQARLFTGAPPRVEVAIDPSRTGEASMIQGLLFEQEGRAVQQAMMPSTGGDGNWRPLDLVMHDVTRNVDGPRSSFEVTFVQGMLWGIIGCVMTFAIGLVTERTRGTFVRLRMAPMTNVQVLGGKALACFATLLLMEVLLVSIGIVVFGLRIDSLGLLAIAMLSASAGFVGVMMLIASLGRTEESTSGAGWALMMPMAMLGGAMIPSIAMPPWMLAASNVSPIKWVSLAFEGAIWRGFTPIDMVLPCGLLLALGLVTFAAGARALR